MSGVQWREEPLSQIAKIERTAVSPDAIRSGDTFIGLEHLDGEGRIDESKLAVDSDIASTKFRYTSQHLLYGKLRPYLRKIALPKGGGVCSTDILPILPRAGVIERQYLFYYLRQQSMIDLATARSVGANLPRLSPSILADFPVRFPPLDEQRRIAAILDKADAIRRKRQQALALADDFLRSAFLEMFGHPATNSKGWDLKPLGELGILERGRSMHRPRNAPELLGGVHPLIQTGDVANAVGGVIQAYRQTYSEIGLRQSRKWPSGTLCITIAANIADAAILDFDACFPDSVVGFTSDAATSAYVHGLLGFLKPIIEARAPQVAQKNINLEILRSLVVPSPHSSQKDRYFNIIRQWRRLFSNMGADLPDSLFASLSQRAFRGDL